MAGKYELKNASGGKYMWNLRAGNGEIILTSETYNAKDSAKTGVASCRTNSPLDGRYERKQSTNAQPYFVLKAANGEPIGRSEMYSSTSAMETGITSCKTNGPSAELVDLT
jgi:uncharacterized protein YegP (UPF0339 family)